MSPPGYICSEVNFPVCKVLDLEQTKYVSEEKAPLGFTINSPYTVALLLISVLCVIRMIAHVDSLYASIGRGEMKTIFSVYAISNTLQLVIVGFGKYFNDQIILFLTVLQVSLASTVFFSLFASGLTINRIYGILGMKSSTCMRLLVILFFSIFSSFIFLCCSTGNSQAILVYLITNTMSILSYILMQARVLSITRADIWNYGILAIILLCYIMTAIHTLVGASFIANISERNLDNLFFVTLFTFIMVMMVHKYWLSTYDFELECLSLPV